MGANAPEWMIGYWGAMFHNMIASGIYITNEADACQYQSEHSEAQVILVDSMAILKKYVGILDRLPEVKAVVCWGLDELPSEQAKDPRFYTWKNFMTLGQSVPDSVIDKIAGKANPATCCNLFYTSGTTGNPKGVMLSHDNIVFACAVYAR